MNFFDSGSLRQFQAASKRSIAKYRDREVDVVWLPLVIYSDSLRPYGVSAHGFEDYMLALDEGVRLRVSQSCSFDAPHRKGPVLS